MAFVRNGGFHLTLQFVFLILKRLFRSCSGEELQNASVLPFPLLRHGWIRPSVPDACHDAVAVCTGGRQCLVGVAPYVMSPSHEELQYRHPTHAFEEVLFAQPKPRFCLLCATTATTAAVLNTRHYY